MGKLKKRYLIKTLKIVLPSLCAVIIIVLGMTGGKICKNFDLEIDKKILDLSYKLPHDVKTYCHDASYIIINKTKIASYAEIKEHNEMLINLLQNKKDDNINKINEIENRTNQSCTIYFSILVAIIGFFITRSFNSNRSNNHKKRLFTHRLGIYLTMYVLLMYFFNIQLEDSKYKPTYRRDKSMNDMIKLANNYPLNLAWYEYNKFCPEKVLAANSKICNRFKRKFYRAISPNILQIIYYIIPLTGIIIWMLLSFSKKQEIHRYIRC